MYSFKDFPYDILLIIISFISKQDLSAVTRTTRGLRDTLLPLLFEDFAIPLNVEKSGFTNFLRSIHESPELARCVKRLDTFNWHAGSIFPPDSKWAFPYHRKPLNKDVKVLCSALESIRIPYPDKKRWLDGLRRELFLTDEDMKACRRFSKPDSFLAILIAKLPNLEVLHLHFYGCYERGEGGRPSNDGAPRDDWEGIYRHSPVAPQFPTWIWKIAALSTSNNIPQGDRWLQKLNYITISHKGNYFKCSQDLPWLRLPSIKTLELTRVYFPREFRAHPRSSPIERLALVEVAANRPILASLLRIPRALDVLHYEYIPPTKSDEQQKDCRLADMIDVLRQHHGNTLTTLVLNLPKPGDRIRHYFDILDSLEDRNNVLEPTIFRGFKNLRILHLGLWHLGKVDWTRHYELGDAREPSEITELGYDDMTPLEDILPPDLHQLSIECGDSRMTQPLKALAAARSYPTYRFPLLRSVSVETRFLGMLDEEDLQMAFGGGCTFTLSSGVPYMQGEDPEWAGIEW